MGFAIVGLHVPYAQQATTSGDLALPHRPNIITMWAKFHPLARLFDIDALKCPAQNKTRRKHSNMSLNHD